MKVRRSRVVPAPPDDVWTTVADPYHLPRWWPRVERVELVQGDGFTQLLRTDKGRAIRADFRVVQSRRPELRRWRQEVEGSSIGRGVHTEGTEDAQLLEDDEIGPEPRRVSRAARAGTGTGRDRLRSRLVRLP